MERPGTATTFICVQYQRLAPSNKKTGFQELKAWTSIRGGSWLFIGSRSIRIKGSYVVGSPQSIPVLFWARCMQFAEWAILKVRHLSGEEIGLVLKK
ncbi:MAG: hypothetical protein JRG74_07105 [Deltaproteobacteria bacterium]|nr:hypothetical protein [Deltaproteobacteria bacterium]MBW2165858.1 hypothetical protein [Deltaproteobacteria bacterium]